MRTVNMQGAKTHLSRLVEQPASGEPFISKPCPTHTETVVGDLGRDSHRIALSDARLVNFDGERVALRFKDYSNGARGKVMLLSGEDLLRRFLLHVLCPKGSCGSGMTAFWPTAAAPDVCPRSAPGSRRRPRSPEIQKMA